jgi:hypothetical protein
MKKSPLQKNLQLPLKVKGIGFLAMSLLFLSFLLISVQVFYLHADNNILKHITYCIAAAGTALLLIFFILTSIYFFKGK